ncbi:hypothetical protein SH661x_000050 [Planctomicrobium sp. SH661]|uniref:hypothetical protein n=1 Tax=Planctomicrobium sp. SH661 TaxID=3448124 RepID=UPI003F5BC9DE
MPVVFARGALREQLDATPIELRPYRPFHFYGNTVRRVHYRGTPFPRFGEVIATPARAAMPRSQNQTYVSEPARERVRETRIASRRQ